ncbi:MAG: nitrous oxide reductase accessory protein NosL [Gammaproteobacteria bacterium SHHR-1]|uniref:nitrous oxide reductase accessory protein NosL n=1 Tax=Magnetovirga frankeli TaxID=947516 RepID=UPI001292ED5E|nr:nitrous oxide reductase accessory protein NosL [gamma proteobacterium SS-5]
MGKAILGTRRDLLKLLGGTGLLGIAGWAQAGPGALLPGKGWLESSGQVCEGDGTPLQFIPKTAPDANPLQDDLRKYPKCPYCGMDRAEYHHSRHLVQYDDDLVDGVCSLHCLAISLSLNMDRGPKAIYAADFGSSAAIKPLALVDGTHYLVGSKLKGTMTANSKKAFASLDAAQAAMAAQGGTLVNFDQALTQAYLDMAKDSQRIRKMRAERRRKMQEKAQPKAG